MCTFGANNRSLFSYFVTPFGTPFFTPFFFSFHSMPFYYANSNSRCVIKLSGRSQACATPLYTHTYELDPRRKRSSPRKSGCPRETPV